MLECVVGRDILPCILVNLTSVRNTKIASSVELEKTEFFLGSAMNVVVGQVMILLRERGLQLIRDIIDAIKTLAVCGDQLRIQQVLADFLFNMVRHAPSPEGRVEIHVHPSLKQTAEGLTLVHKEFSVPLTGLCGARQHIDNNGNCERSYLLHSSATIARLHTSIQGGKEQKRPIRAMGLQMPWAQEL